jgi:hypothetical protein
MRLFFSWLVVLMFVSAAAAQPVPTPEQKAIKTTMNIAELIRYDLPVVGHSANDVTQSRR